LEVELVEIKKQNDSLKKIVDLYKTKYVFDDVFPSIRRTKPDSIANGSRYFCGEIAMTAFNSDDYALITQDIQTEWDQISPDTLKSTYGSFKFNVKITGHDTVRYHLYSKHTLEGKQFEKLISIPINSKNFP